MLTRNIAQFRANIEIHAAADLLDGGNYYNAKTGQACFIGCQVKSNDLTLLQEQYGIPVTLTRVLENVFEALPSKAEKVAFAKSVGDAVGRDGKDLSRVVWAFLAAELRALPETTDAVQAAIDPVIAGMDLLASRQEWPAADAAAAAAYAAYTADDAARSADDAGDDAAARATADVAEAAYATARAADDAAYAAYATGEAAYAAARAATTVRLRQCDTLIALIAAA